MVKVTFLGADTCCLRHTFRPKVEDICKQKGFEFRYVDADDDDNADILALYNVRSIPFVVIYNGDDNLYKGIAADALNALKSL